MYLKTKFQNQKSKTWKTMANTMHRKERKLACKTENLASCVLLQSPNNASHVSRTNDTHNPLGPVHRL